MKKGVTPLLLAATVMLLAGCNHSSSIKKAIEKQLEQYPESRVQDIYKCFCQDNLGPGHLITNREAAEVYLMQELQLCREEFESGIIERPQNIFVPVGDKHNYVRVDLCAVLDSLISAEALLEAFVQSANEGKTVSDAQWKRKWAAVATVIRKDYLYIPDSERDLAAIDSLLAAGHFILHHSPAYSKAYHPHYRIISSDLLATCLPPADKKADAGR